MGASLLRKLPFFSVFIISGMGLAIPHRALTTLVVPPSLAPGADKDFVTVYGLCDSSTPRQQQDVADGGPRLKYIQDVSLARAEATTPGSPGQGGKGLPTPTSLVTFRSLQPIPVPTFPPMRGPGLVALPSSVYPAILATSPTPSPVSGSSTTHIITPSTRIIVIASVIGGILSIALCVFLFTNPTLRSKLCGIFACRKPKNSKNAKGVSSSNNIDEPPTPQPDPTLAEKTPSPTKHDKGPDETLDNIAPPKTPAPAHSSEHTDTPRASILASPGDSNPTTGITFAPPPNSPPRPRRPPTEDSPALSDSVYLACSDQPYVVVASRPFSEGDINNSSPATNRKRLLTPSQFFALHVPSILANLYTSKSSTSDAARKPGESPHSLAKNTQLSGSKTAKASPSAEDSTENDAALTGPVSHKDIKHRKSRSASGWAYPTRP